MNPKGELLKKAFDIVSERKLDDKALNYLIRSVRIVLMDAGFDKDAKSLRDDEIALEKSELASSSCESKSVTLSKKSSVVKTNSSFSVENILSDDAKSKNRVSSAGASSHPSTGISPLKALETFVETNFPSTSAADPVNPKQRGHNKRSLGKEATTEGKQRKVSQEDAGSMFIEKGGKKMKKKDRNSKIE